MQVHRFVTQGTIEEKIAELLSRKRALADTVLGRGEAGLTELSNDELRDLVELRAGSRPGSPDRRAQTVTHPRIPPRRGGGAGTWWSKAWGRAVEESAFAVAELRRGRALARAGEVGAIAVDSGSAVAAVKDGDDAWTVTISVPAAGRPRRARPSSSSSAPSRGGSPRCSPGSCRTRCVEACEEAGIELLPYGGELGSTCTCDSWLDPCPHALAVLTQVGWLLQDGPVRAAPAAGAVPRGGAGRAARARGPVRRPGDGDDPGAGDPVATTSPWPRTPPCGPRGC